MSINLDKLAGLIGPAGGPSTIGSSGKTFGAGNRQSTTLGSPVGKTTADFMAMLQDSAGTSANPQAKATSASVTGKSLVSDGGKSGFEVGDSDGKAVDPERAKIKKLSEDFEAIFLNLVLKAMRQSVQKSGLVDGGNAEDIYKSMLDSEYAKQMASQGAAGLAQNIESFMLEASGRQKETAKELTHLSNSERARIAGSYEQTRLRPR